MDPDSPVLPLENFTHFCKTNRQSIIEAFKTCVGPAICRKDNCRDCKDAKDVNITKVLCDLWLDMSDEEKKPYDEMANNDKKRYEADYAEYMKVVKARSAQA